jgi:hypothetical protein
MVTPSWAASAAVRRAASNSVVKLSKWELIHVPGTIPPFLRRRCGFSPRVACSTRSLTIPALAPKRAHRMELHTNLEREGEGEHSLSSR